MNPNIMNNDVRTRGNGHSMTYSDYTSIDTSNSFCYSTESGSSLLSQSLPDSGVYDLGQASLPKELLGWQKATLRIWQTNNKQRATEIDEIASLFAEILGASQNLIKFYLHYLFGNVSGRYLQGDNGSASANPQRSNDQGSFVHANGTEHHPNAPDMFPNHALQLPQCPISTTPAPPRALYLPTVQVDLSSAAGVHSRQPPLNFNTTGLAITNDGTARAEREKETTMPMNPTYNNAMPSAEVSQSHATQDKPVQDLIPVFSIPRGRVILTPSLSAVIERLRLARRTKGCQRIRSHEKQCGNYECTLGCGRSFKTAHDLFRHEGTVLPQEFWFCNVCGDEQHASHKHVFTREDKIRHHLKLSHANLGYISEFKVPNVPESFPERCGLCTHHRHRTWRDRCNHIRRYHRKPSTPAKAADGDNDASGKSMSGPGDDDDDDDVDGNNKGSDANKEDPTNGSDRNTGPGDSGKPPDTQPDDGMDEEEPPDTTNDDFSEFLNFGNPAYWGQEVKIALKRITTFENHGESDAPLEPLLIKYIGQVNQKGGTAAVFKVETWSNDDALGDGQRQLRVVKRYSSEHQLLFQRELEAFSILSQQKNEHPNIIRCLGSFTQYGAQGRTSYNLLLESAQCDLSEYFADTAPPSTTLEIKTFWTQLRGIADALQSIHGLDGKQGSYVGWHADVKPDNILYMDGTFKLADFGLSKFAERKDEQPAKEIMHGGTATYLAPEVYEWNPREAVSQSVDVWSLGCILSMAATWIIEGFHGIREFETLRKHAISPSGTNSAAKFHDGKQVLPHVKSWHDQLRARANNDDPTTCKILDLVDNHLLRSNASLRYDAQEVSRAIALIVHEADMGGREAVTNFEVEAIMSASSLEERTPSDRAAAAQASSSDEGDIAIVAPIPPPRLIISERPESQAVLHDDVSHELQTLTCAHCQEYRSRCCCYGSTYRSDTLWETQAYKAHHRRRDTELPQEADVGVCGLFYEEPFSSFTGYSSQDFWANSLASNQSSRSYYQEANSIPDPLSSNAFEFAMPGMMHRHSYAPQLEWPFPATVPPPINPEFDDSSSWALPGITPPSVAMHRFMSDPTPYPHTAGQKDGISSRLYGCLDPSLTVPTPLPTTLPTGSLSQEAKRRRRRESHFMVQHRDSINERIHDLSFLFSQLSRLILPHRPDDEEIHKHLGGSANSSSLPMAPRGSDKWLCASCFGAPNSDFTRCGVCHHRLLVRANTSFSPGQLEQETLQEAYEQARIDQSRISEEAIVERQKTWDEANRVVPYFRPTVSALSLGTSRSISTLDSRSRGGSRVFSANTGALAKALELVEPSLEYNSGSHQSLDNLSRNLDQFLTGRQEHRKTINVRTEHFWGYTELRQLKKLLGEFERSRHRRTDRSNIHIRFIVPGDEGFVVHWLSELTRIFTFVSVRLRFPGCMDLMEPERVHGDYRRHAANPRAFDRQIRTYPSDPVDRSYAVRDRGRSAYSGWAYPTFGHDLTPSYQFEFHFARENFIESGHHYDSVNSNNSLSRTDPVDHISAQEPDEHGDKTDPSPLYPTCSGCQHCCRCPRHHYSVCSRNHPRRYLQLKGGSMNSKGVCPKCNQHRRKRTRSSEHCSFNRCLIGCSEDGDRHSKRRRIS
ncbi:hypothetical protein CC80DRAFT_161626 [Byssothecium circinans]|uniref:Protein kinase domain-containing protein n=1 Tax=Byssothecium circinans TaxID=147558 RepID=A0A6A5UC40_9PLEO|nr:hypothetical protein CC80DRAFT_161626 [Byssothecium circinans]